MFRFAKNNNIRKLLIILLANLVFYSCKKESVNTALPQTTYFAAIDKYLQENLQQADYNQIDLKNSITGSPDSGRTVFVHVPFKGIDIENNFIFLQTDKEGNCTGSSILQYVPANNSMASFTDSVTINKIDKSDTKELLLNQGKAVINLVQSVLPTTPYDGLPPVTVTAYIPSQSTYTPTYLISTGALIYGNNNGVGGNNGGNNGGNPGYASAGYYTPITGGGSNPGTQVSGGIPNGTVVKVEFDHPETKDAEDINKIFNCFNSIPEAGAKYSLKLCVDVPINTSPYSPVDDALSPGHTFLVLTKTNGSQTITKSFGFYPSVGWKSLLNPVDGKIVNDAQHEINASLEMPNLTQANFNTIKSNAIGLVTKKYDLGLYNCSNYALDVFNSVRPANPINVNVLVRNIVFDYTGVVTINVNKSPQMTYKSLFDKFENGDSESNNLVFNLNSTYQSPLTTGGCN
ncbi:MAG: hypothetical protein ABI921_14650 [Panacibacter sp.]